MRKRGNGIVEKTARPKTLFCVYEHIERPLLTLRTAPPPARECHEWGSGVAKYCCGASVAIGTSLPCGEWSLLGEKRTFNQPRFVTRIPECTL